MRGMKQQRETLTEPDQNDGLVCSGPETRLDEEIFLRKLEI